MGFRNIRFHKILSVKLSSPQLFDFLIDVNFVRVWMSYNYDA